MPTTKKKTTKKSKKNPGVRRNGKVLYGAAAKAVLKRRAAKKRRAAVKNPKPAAKKAATRFAKVSKKRPAKKAATSAFTRRRASTSTAKKPNPRYFVTGVSAGGDSRELGILVAPNKMQAVKKAKSVYGRSGFTKFTAVLSDKQDYYGGEKRAPLPKQKKAAKKKNAGRTIYGSRRIGRRNPDGELYETFTGQQHTGHAAVIAPTGAPRNLDELGDFVEFKWMDADGKRHTVNLEDQGIAAKLAGHQYADGRFELVLTSAPGQKLPFFGDYLPAGDHGYIYEVTYRAQKAHLGDAKPRLYYHKLGEETGVPPIFHINRDGELIFKGGEYWIEASGIHN